MAKWRFWTVVMNHSVAIQKSGQVVYSVMVSITHITTKMSCSILLPCEPYSEGVSLSGMFGTYTQWLHLKMWHQLWSNWGTIEDVTSCKSHCQLLEFAVFRAHLLIGLMGFWAIFSCGEEQGSHCWAVRVLGSHSDAIKSKNAIKIILYDYI